MPHRSNQVVASQDRALPQPDLPSPRPPPRRLLVGWATALAALGASTLLLLAGLWFIRFSIAEFILGAALAERGAEADFRVVNLDFSGVTLSGVRFGSETSPDAAIPLVEVRWEWRGPTPQVTSLRLTEPRLRLRLDPAGRLSAGALDRLGGPPSGRRPALPQIGLEIIDGAAFLDAPFGRVEASLQASGTIGRDFSAVARIPQTSRPGANYALANGRGELLVVARDNALSFRLAAEAERLVWNGAQVDSAVVSASGSAPLDLASYEATAAWQAAALRSHDMSASSVRGAAVLRATAQDDALTVADWRGSAQVTSDGARFGDNAMRSARFDVAAHGSNTTGEARWSMNAARFEGLALISERPSANGAFAFDVRADEPYSGTARIVLAGSHLDAAAQRDLHRAFPELGGTPVGPTFDHAESALSAAADQFDLTLPLTFDTIDRQARVRLTELADVRAATGARLHVSPLRQDAPTVVLQWPGPVLSGAVAAELVGGGAPHATLLLDTLNWTPEAPFEADGTITLENWRASGASIAADELGVTIAVPHPGLGRIDLRGPARITGPFGDGEIRDLSSSLNVAITWGAGWRVTPNSGCLPTRLGGLDVAGLSFANGAFSLCSIGDALIAADAGDRLSGGFIIRRLALNGRMAGPAAQPARLSAGSLAGRFSGHTGDVALALEADTPGLAVDMAEGRTLAIALQNMTGEARIGDGWSVAGAFREGTLSDPSLPGSVSTIAGRWSARSENREVVLRVEAGEALLTANRPASESERELFHPLQLAGVNAVLRGGRLEANGAIVLQSNSRQLASFTAFHDVDEGVGGAQVVAPEIVFGQGFQPYDVSERARGYIDNVRGPTSLAADISWNRESIDGTGRLRLDGVSLAMATIPIIENVRGEIFFDDVFALTTPPGQQVQVGLLNPGVAVTNGAIQFQLLPQNTVSLERAEFEFARGVLAVTPTTIALGAPETRVELTLRDVEASDLITTLNVPDLAATGRVEGSFPLVLTRRTALIENGVLRAQPGGGTISYSGDAGQSFTGAARIAFDALRSFRYEDLVLTLNGDLNGEVVSAIEFTGRNAGEPVDLGPVASVPGVGHVNVRGVPFAFHVRITAPFRRLAQTAASIANPGVILNPPERDEEPREVDQQPPAPR